MRMRMRTVKIVIEKKKFCVPVWSEDITHYFVEANSAKEAEEILNECIEEGDATHILNKCKSCDCGILSNSIKEIKEEK